MRRQLLESYTNPDVKESIGGREEMKAKLQTFLGLADNMPEDNIELVLRNLDELDVYFSNGLEENSH